MSEHHEPDNTPLPHHTKCDVAIVGWGPVGMIMSCLLAQRGLDVVVVERWPARYGLSRAGHCDSETMRTYQTLGIADDIELVVRPMLLWSLVSADLEVLTTINLGQAGGGWKDSYLSYQPEIEEIFERRALDLGVHLYMDVTATGLEQDADHARLTVRPSQGDDSDSRTIEAKYVIGADGARSFVRDAVGVVRRDLGFRALDQLVIDFEHNDPDRDMPQLPEVYQILDVNRPVLAGRWSGPRHSRFEFSAVAGETREYLEDIDTCWEFLKSWGLTPAEGTVSRHAVYNFESTIAERWRSDRVFLIGDAAHTMPPFMGQGMCSGIRDGINLAWKIDAVLAGRADDSLLDTYQTEREPHVRGVIDMSMAVGDTALMRDPDKARERDAALRAGDLPTPPRFPRQGTGVVVSPESSYDLDVAGRPAPQARIALGRRVARLDDFHGAGWKIVSRHDVPLTLFNDRQRRLIDELGIEFLHVSRGPGGDYYVDIDGEYDLWFRANGTRAFLSRPDNYIFGAVETNDDLPALLDELAGSLVDHGWHSTADHAVTA